READGKAKIPRAVSIRADRFADLANTSERIRSDGCIGGALIHMPLHRPCALQVREEFLRELFSILVRVFRSVGIAIAMAQSLGNRFIEVHVVRSSGHGLIAGNDAQTQAR